MNNEFEVAVCVIVAVIVAVHATPNVLERKYRFHPKKEKYPAVTTCESGG